MKFLEGPNKFRVLSPVTMGFEYWTEDKKPIRAKELWNVIPLNADIRKGWNPKHFWAFVVWNFQTKSVEILEITQATIQSALKELIVSEEWGSPTGYSITVNRKGTDINTEYTVVPSPAKETPAEIIQAYKDKPIDLEQLFTGGNPFNPEEARAENPVLSETLEDGSPLPEEY